MTIGEVRNKIASGNEFEFKWTKPLAEPQEFSSKESKEWKGIRLLEVIFGDPEHSEPRDLDDNEELEKLLSKNENRWCIEVLQADIDGLYAGGALRTQMQDMYPRILEFGAYEEDPGGKPAKERIGVESSSNVPGKI